MYVLRDYQDEAVNEVIAFFDDAQQIKNPVAIGVKKGLTVYPRSCVLDLATGAGKSLIVAKLAHHYWQTQSKRVLCIQPTKELTEQNHEKFEDMTGESASIFSGSIRKETEHPVIFGTPQTVLNAIDQYVDAFNGEHYALLVVDEAHRNTKATRELYEAMLKGNPNLLLLGLSATPYRLGEGYIYELDETNQKLDERVCRAPMFKKLVYSVGAPYLINSGYLTPPAWGESTSYDTSGLVIERGQFTPESVQATFEDNDKTVQIVNDIIARSADRKGVMIFGSTLKHCEEIMNILPPGESAMVSGDTRKAAREKIIAKFKAQKYKYLVNVSTLTTGFDAPHVDLIAIMRGTESHALYIQITGRGLRLFEGKEDCLMLDYAGNFERLGLKEDDAEMFTPVFDIAESKEGQEHDVYCPQCQARNNVIVPYQFACDMVENGWGIDPNGFLIDLMGHRIDAPESENVAWADDKMVAHAGRRCKGEHLINGKYRRCEFYWIYRTCENCGEKNDIAARECRSCCEQLINPNEQLVLTPQMNVERTLTPKGTANQKAFEAMKRSTEVATANTFRSIDIHVEKMHQKGGYPRLTIMVDNHKKVFCNFNEDWETLNKQAHKVFHMLCVEGFGLAWCRQNLNNESLYGMLTIVSQEWYVKGLNFNNPNHPIKTISMFKKKEFWQITDINAPEFVFDINEDYT